MLFQYFHHFPPTQSKSPRSSLVSLDPMHPPPSTPWPAAPFVGSAGRRRRPGAERSAAAPGAAGARGSWRRPRWGDDLPGPPPGRKVGKTEKTTEKLGKIWNLGFFLGKTEVWDGLGYWKNDWRWMGLSGFCEFSFASFDMDQSGQIDGDIN